jgi:hypothetical protein
MSGVLSKDVLLIIFDMISLKDKIHSRRVCKRWYHILTEETRFWDGGNYYNLLKRFEKNGIIPELRVLLANEKITFKQLRVVETVDWDLESDKSFGNWYLNYWIQHTQEPFYSDQYQYAVVAYLSGSYPMYFEKRPIYSVDCDFIGSLFNYWGFRLIKEFRLSPFLFDWDNRDCIRIPRKFWNILFSTKHGYEFVVKQVIPVDRLKDIHEKILETLVSKPEWWQYIGPGKIDVHQLNTIKETNSLRQLINKRKNGKTKK